MKCEAKVCRRRLRVAAQSNRPDLPVLAVNEYRGLKQEAGNNQYLASHAGRCGGPLLLILRVMQF